MRQSLDINRFFSKRDADRAEPAEPAVQAPPARARANTDVPNDRLKRKPSVRELFKSNISSLSKRVSRRGKRQTRVEPSTSRRASRVLNVTTVTTTAEGKDNLRRSSDDHSDWSNDNSKSPFSEASPTHQELRPLTGNPPDSSNRMTKMTTLTEELLPSMYSETDLKELFCGAPELHPTVAANTIAPLISYYDLSMDRLDDTRDYTEFKHRTFNASSNRSDTAALMTSGHSDLDARFRAVEVPDMRGERGLEPGTFGCDHFLQLAVADARIVDDDFDNTTKRRVLYSEPTKLGLQPVNVEVLIDRLSELGDMEEQRRQSDDRSIAVPNDQKTSEMYLDLFARLLTPPGRKPFIEKASTALKIQAYALINVLTEKQLWYDFSLVETRIRLGQFLWVTDDLVAEQGLVSERDTILLQITLAAELLVRLEAINEAKHSEDDSADSGIDLSRKVQWDLVLAKRFLENVRIAPGRVNDNKDDPSKQNRSSLFSMLSFVTARETFEEANNTVEPVLYPRHEKRQLEGLLRFAETLKWPHAANVLQKLEAHVEKATFQMYTGFATPIHTPGSFTGNRDSYFGIHDRPTLGRGKSAQSVQLLPPSGFDVDNSDAGGWLSRSWLTGLVLPGEPACHFLISTLLENSPQAIEALGDSANLYGGFVYRSRTYWSKSCIVGRVLAASNDAKDIMGWVSAPYITPSASQQPDDWISIDCVEHAWPARPRIADPQALSALSAAFPRDQAGRLTEEDFTYPADSPPTTSNEVVFNGIIFESNNTTYELSAPADTASKSDNDNNNSSSDEETPTISATSTRTAICSFTDPSNPKISPLRFPLKHEVYFITSSPCFPRPNLGSGSGSKLASPTSASNSSPTFQRRQREDSFAPSGPITVPSSPTSNDKTTATSPKKQKKDKDLPFLPCHPLHKNYTYTLEPVTALLNGTERSRLEHSITGTENSTNTETKTSPPGAVTEDDRPIVVLDCRGAQSRDLEVLGRSWCASVGIDAVVGRAGRTCLGCCVREAKGLGVGVVLRV